MSDTQHPINPDSRFLRAVLDATNDAIFIHDLKAGVLIDVNRRAAEMYGYSRDHFIGTGIGRISSGIAPYTERDALKWVLKVRRGKSQIIEWQAKHADGHLFPVEVSVRSEMIHDRHLVIACVRDISERKAADDYFQAIFNASSDPLFIHDAQTGAILDVNQRAEELYEISRDELATLDVGKISVNEAPYTQAEAVSWIQKARSKGPQRFEWKARSARSGRIFTCDVSMRAQVIGGRELVLVTGRDISERKEIEDILRTSRQRLSCHIENTPLAAIEWDMNWNIVAWNPAAEKIFGYPREAVLGSPAMQIVPEGDRDHVQLMMSRMHAQTGGLRSTNKNITKDGRILLCEWYNTVLTDEAGNVTGVASMVMDITESRRAEQQAQATLDALSAHIAILDQDGKIIAVNRSWEAFAIQQGTPPETCSAGTNYLAVCASATGKDTEDATRFTEGLRAVLAGERASFEMEYPCETPEKLLWFTARITAFPDEDDPRVAVAHEDITARRNAEIQRAESEEKLRGILENSTNMFYSHTTEHELTYLSPQIKDVLGYEIEEALRRWTEMASDHPVNDRGLQLTQEAIRTGKPQPPYELQLVHKDGHPVWVEVHEAPAVENGKTVAIVGSLTDITARKAAEEEMHARHQEQERFNKAATGRELRMMELKEEVNRLCLQLGKEEPYPLCTVENSFTGVPDEIG